MKSYDNGWNRLSDEERLEIWFDENKVKMQGEPDGFKIDDYKNMMENFCISCKNPRIYDYINFTGDIRHFMPKDREILVRGFFAMYNLSPEMLLLRSIFGEYEPGKN
jgi:hypothetical protein